MPSPLQQLLAKYRSTAKSKRELGSYFEELIQSYLRFEPVYAALYSDVWLLSDVPEEYGVSKQDTGIDLVAKTHDTNELHAIQCKFYDEGHRVQKSDIDSFFTASGQKPFTRRVLILTSTNWSTNAEAALFDQQPPVTCIDLNDLEGSQIDWSKFHSDEVPKLKPKFDPRPHQKTAIKQVIAGLAEADRGKLIMACGTGKTFTSLQIAQEVAGGGKRVLFLVPSLALLSQTLTEWTQQSRVPLHSFAVCSDAHVGKKRKKDDDIVQTFVHELRYPATTDGRRLAEEMAKRHDAASMSVVYSTYHSIEAIHDAQVEHGLPAFDLIVCDEAHRTTGATFESETESAFVRVHDNNFIKGQKRLYMTATPRIYADSAKAKAEQDSIAICSMDDESLYGKQLHVITFSEAVELGLLTDYKVVVLTIDEDHVSGRLQSLLKDDDNQLKVDDAARIIGCWKALSKQGLAEELQGDASPMQRAVAFCQVIEPKSGRTHKVSSKQIAGMFQDVVEAYQSQNDQQDDASLLTCETAHVDGSMNAAEKEELINWLKEEPAPDTCRVLSNVRCLSEGVDVPALDAVLFLSPRSSQVEVVQSVGRVMRRAPGKKLGYVVLPVVIPHGMTPHEALADNKVYKVVWEVLQALRSHDDRFDSLINKLDLIKDSSGKMEVIAITDSLSAKPKGNSKRDAGKGQHTLGSETAAVKDVQKKIQFNVGELEKALYAKLVKKCGNRLYWEEWANDIAKIAGTHISRIKAIVVDPKNTKEIQAFQSFANELRDDLNDSITDDEIIEMLAQHLITKPVFDALFADYSFASNNPVSQGMQNILDLLNEHRLDKEVDTLDKFYKSVERRAAGIDKAEGKQKIVVELYDKFFRNAFPRMTERLGIVYTPVEVVDFIIHSVNDILQEEFGQTLGSEGVHILDPFVGTGTFITRLMQSGLITPEQLPHKYKHEIHCNEIVLLAYYIAAINIEAVYHSIVSDKAQADDGDAPAYEPFEGILLTDTFAMYESDDLIEQFFPDNSQRRKRQKNLDIRVIVGNPPYAAGQKKAGDGTKAVKYRLLDGRIAETFVKKASKKGGKRSQYNSYIRAIRWASDRVGKDGVIGLVCSASFLDNAGYDGIRNCIQEEFSRVFVFHLRGNARTSGEQRKKEKDNVFGQGSREPVAICLFVKKAGYTGDSAQISFYDIGDYLSRAEKLSRIKELHDVHQLANSTGWSEITPNKFGDWLSQRNEFPVNFLKLGSKKKNDQLVFSMFSSGVVSGRDTYVFNSSNTLLAENAAQMIEFFNSEVARYADFVQENDELPDGFRIEEYVTQDFEKISWGGGNWQSVLRRRETQEFSHDEIGPCLYRPFTKQWHYGGRTFNHSFYSMKSIYPTPQHDNKVICMSGRGTNKPFGVLMANMLVDYETVSKGQCFPLHVYASVESDEDETLFDGDEKSSRSENITDFALQRFQQAYNEKAITKEDLFYYIYGLLHSPEYRERYKDNLSKELPRIPAVKKLEDFQAFSQAGRDLAHWHLDYETVKQHPVTLDFTGKPKSLKECKNEHFYVRKMKFHKIKDPETGKRVYDKATIIYNDYITIRDIPLKAYDYVVNGKSAVEWVMERQAVTTDKKSGIVNDANLWATETMDNAAYPLELLQRVIRVSLETMKIVNSLPKLEID